MNGVENNISNSLIMFIGLKWSKLIPSDLAATFLLEL